MKVSKNYKVTMTQMKILVVQVVRIQMIVHHQGHHHSQMIILQRNHQKEGMRMKIKAAEKQLLG